MATPFFTGWLAEGVGSGSSFVEIVAAGYAREPASLSALSAGQTALQAGVTFNAPGAAIKITQRAFFDAAVGGNLILFWNLYAPLSLQPSQTDTISAGSLTFSFPALAGNATTTEILWAAGTAVGSTSQGAPLLAGSPVSVTAGVLAAIGGSSSGSGTTSTGLPAATLGNTVATPPSGALSVLLNGTVVEYISLTHLATALGVSSVSGGALPTPSTGNTIASPGTAVVPLVTASGIIEYITPTNFANAVSLSGGATLPTPSSNNTITSTGTTVVPLVTSGGVVEYITPTNFAAAIGVSGGSGLPTPTAGNTVTSPGSLVVPLVTNTGSVEFITPANIASALGLGGAAGLPVPGSSNTVATIGTTASIPFIAAGGTSVAYITPTNFIDSIGNYPTAATTNAVHSSDLILLYQGGTIAQVGSIGGLFAAFQTYQQANLPQLSLTTPGTIAAGSVFNVTGTIYNYTTTPQLLLSIDSGAYGALPAGSSVSLSSSPNINLVIGSLAVGPHTAQIKDANGVYSNAISIAASNLPSVIVAAPIGVQPSKAYQATATLQNYGTAVPTLQYSIDSGGFAALPNGSTVGTTGATIANLPGLAAGTHTIEVEDTTNAVFSNTATFVVATETLTLNNPGSQYASTAFNLTGSYVNGAPTGFDYSITNGATWTTASSPTVTGGGNGAFAFPVTISVANANESIEVRDHNLPSIVSNSQTFAVAPAPTPATIVAGSAISQSGSQVTLLFSEPVTLPNTSGLTLFANGAMDAITWPNATVSSSSQTGTLALPITSGETVTYNTTNIGFSFPNLAALTTGATIANNSTLAPSVGVTTPVGWVQNASQQLSGTYVGPAPTGFNVKFDAGSYTALASPAIGSGAWSGTITSPAAGSHTLTVQEVPNTAITVTTGSFSVSSGFDLLFTGAAGSPTGNQVLTPFSGSASTFQLDGSGNLELLSTSYQYAALAALGVQGDGTLTAYIATNYQGPFALLFRINAAMTQYYGILYNGSLVQLYFSGTGGAGFASGSYATPSVLSTLAVQYVGTSITVFANGSSLGSWTDSNVTAAGYVGIGAVAGGGTTRISQVAHS